MAANIDAASVVQPWTETNWCIDDYRVDEGVIEFSGWAVCAEGARARDLDLWVNDRKQRKVLGRLARPDVHALFPDRDGSATCGFRVRVEYALAALRPEKPLRISLSSGRKMLEHLDYYFAGEVAPMPPGVNRHRVDGTDGLAAFYIEGFTAFVKIGRAIKECTGLSYVDFDTVLDWGVGCGRVTRYLPPRDRVIGVDIDPVNIAWCRDNMPWIEAYHVNTSPPMLVDDESIDLVIGVSVLSHLRIADMTAWMEELARVTRRGAILAVTTHGRVTFGRTTLGGEWFGVWQGIGFMDGGLNPNIDGASLDDPDFYHNVFITQQFFHDAVSRHFEVMAFREGIIGNSQDLHILRRR